MTKCENVDKAEDLKITEKLIGIMTKLFAEAGVATDVIEYVDLIDDLGMDSVNFVSLIIELEEEFDVQIPDEWLRMDTFRTYTQIYTAIEALVRERENGNG